MVEITIICLIYKSTKLAEAIYESLKRYTPRLSDGSAELLFVANDPTVHLVNFLETKEYPYIVNVNKHLSEDDLYGLGYGSPEYIRRVYQGYNQGILHARGQKIVLINSDNFFSEDWLENLLKYSDYKTVVCSTLVEPGHDRFGVFPTAVCRDFGRTTEDFRNNDFQDFASKIALTGYTSGGAYMPCLLYKDIAVMAGLYPEGNIAGSSFDEIKRYGDEEFYDKLKQFGVKHITAKDSIVYHLKEGEKSEETDEVLIIDDEKYTYSGLGETHKVVPKDLINYIKPDIKHSEIMDALGEKYTILILNFLTAEELYKQIEQILRQTIKNFQIVVLYSDDNVIGNKIENIIYANVNDEKGKYEYLYALFNKMYGEFLIIMNPERTYPNDLIENITEKEMIYYMGESIGSSTNVMDLPENFVLTKSFINEHIHEIIGKILSNGKLKINTKRLKIPIATPVQEQLSSMVATELPKSNHKLPYKIIRKVYREGPLAATRAVHKRMKNK